MTNTSIKKTISIKNQTLAALGAIIAAVALPELFHVIGAVSGIGTGLGEILLPMHFPVLLTGLLAGPYAAAAAGLISPLVSFALTGMPTSILLPYMMLELFVYGLISGMLRNKAIPSVGKILIAQISGRAVRAAAILVSVYLLDASAPSVSIIYTSIKTGLFGLILQWTMLPLIIYRIENGKRND